MDLRDCLVIAILAFAGVAVILLLIRVGEAERDVSDLRRDLSRLADLSARAAGDPARLMRAHLEQHHSNLESWRANANSN